MQRVPPKVQRALRDLLRKYQARGIDVFLFGSVAETWPEYRKGSDFDIGFKIPAGRKDAEESKREISRDASSLPTIRAVDVVDFSVVDDSFREIANTQARREL